MEFNEWKKTMETDATIENKKLKNEISNLRASNKKKDDDYHELEKKLSSLEDDCRALANRCFVTTGGLFCMNCVLHSYDCEHMPTWQDQLRMARSMKQEFEKGGNKND